LQHGAEGWALVKWYCLHVRPQCERAVAEQLFGHCQTFWPHRQTHDRWNRITRRPWFPGYVFVGMEDESPAWKWRILQVPQVLEILRSGGEPAVIPSSEIESLRILANSKASVMAHSMVKVGQTVRVVKGPLQGVEGKVMRFANRSATLLIVSIELLGRAVATELDPETIEPVARRDLQPLVA
jgi:transcription antitermination factor NusG